MLILFPGWENMAEQNSEPESAEAAPVQHVKIKHKIKHFIQHVGKVEVSARSITRKYETFYI